MCCVELFDVDGELLANEMAPRVHNSGHWTIEGADTSQFENHLRAVLGWPLGSTAARRCERDGQLHRRDARRRRGARGARRAPPRLRQGAAPGRKVGHVTVVARDAAALETPLARVQELVAAATDG